MNLRLEAILKKEKNLYKDITGNLKGKNFAELNRGLAETIAMLLERKELIEQLNQGVLADDVREELYERIENNNKYFAGVDRDDINIKFMQADDSYAKSAEWQNLHMAFLSTASVASYKAADKYIEDLKDLKKRKKEIDESYKNVNRKIEDFKKHVPGVDSTNAKEKIDEFQKDKLKLIETENKLKNDLYKYTENNKIITSKYNKLQEENKELKIKKEIYEKVFQEVQKETKRFNFLSGSEIDKIIQKRKDALLQERTNIEKQSPKIKEYFETAIKLDHDERKDFLNEFEEMLNEISDMGYEGNLPLDLLSSKLRDRSVTTGDEADLYAKKFDAYVDRLTDLRYRNDSQYIAAKEEYAIARKNRENASNTLPLYWKEIRSLSLDEAFQIQTDIYNEIVDEADVELNKHRDKLDANDKKLVEDYISKAKKEREYVETLTAIKEKNEAAREQDIQENIISSAGKRVVSREEAAMYYDKYIAKKFATYINNKISIISEEITGKDTLGKYNLSSETAITMRADKWLKAQIKQLEDTINKNSTEISKIEPEISAFNAKKADYEKNILDTQLEERTKTNQISKIANMFNQNNGFNLKEYEEALDKNCKDVPKLDVSAVMEEKLVSGFALYQMADAYKGNHNDSPEFAAMKASMAYVMYWGTDNAIPPTYPNAPKTFEDAITQLKENCKKYVDAKNNQKRPFPSKMRHLRFQIAKAFDMYADTQKASLKDIAKSEQLADKWNKYFEIRTEEKNKFELQKEGGIPNIKLEEIHQDESVLEADETSFDM